MISVATTQLYAALVRTGVWFQSVPLELQEKLLAAGNLRQLSEGQRLFAKGDPPDGLYCIVAGSIRATTITAAGAEALLAIIEPPHWYGEIALFDKQARTHDAWADAATTLIHVPLAALNEMLHEQPAYWHAFGLLLAQRMRVVFNAIEETALLPAAARLASRLVTIAEGYGESRQRTRRVLRLPQDQLGLMLSLSRQTVNQILKQIAATGAISLVRGGIEILDIDALRKLALST